MQSPDCNNHMNHSFIKFKFIDIISSHISKDNPINIIINDILINEYIHDLKDHTNENLFLTNLKQNNNHDDTSMDQNKISLLKSACAKNW